MRQIRPITRILGLAATGVLVLAACGDDSDDEDVSADEPAGETTDEGEEPTVDPEALNLVSEGTLTVCSDAPYEPFEFQDEDDEWTGFDMELMREIANRLELDMAVSVQPFEGIWLAPQAGDCDIVASAMTITEEREENALFSDPYFDADQSLLVPADDADELASLEDLDDHNIGVQAGTTGADYAEENAPDGASVIEFEEEGPIFLALESGDLDAVLQDLPVNGWRAVQSDDALVVVETYTTDEEYGFATTPDNEALIDAVNQVLGDINEDGTYDDLHAEWFGETAE